MALQECCVSFMQKHRKIATVEASLHFIMGKLSTFFYQYTWCVSINTINTPVLSVLVSWSLPFLTCFHSFILYMDFASGGLAQNFWEVLVLKSKRCLKPMQSQGRRVWFTWSATLTAEQGLGACVRVSVHRALGIHWATHHLFIWNQPHHHPYSGYLRFGDIWLLLKVDKQGVLVFFMARGTF